MVNKNNSAASKPQDILIYLCIISVAAADGYLARKLNQMSDFGAWVSCLVVYSSCLLVRSTAIFTTNYDDPDPS